MSPNRQGRAAAVRRTVVVLLVVIAAGACTFALRGPPGPAAAAVPPRLVTPLWSARRVPGPVVGAVADQRLQAGLMARTGGNPSCFAVDDDATGRVADAGLDQLRTPASTQKLLTATAALAHLGPDFRFETTAVAANGVHGGAVDRLYLVGRGDPLIATPEAIAAIARDPETKGDVSTPLAQLADALVQAGVRRIPGGVVGDDSRYDDTRYVPAWPTGYRADREIGPIGALTVDNGFGGADGSGPAAADPAVNAADQLARLLAARGVTVGPASAGRAPKGAVTVATLRSAPFAQVLTAFLSSSDNQAGEMLVRENAVQAGRPGTTAEGAAATLATLSDLGLPTAGTVMVDGSGLARQDRTSCTLLLGILGLTSRPRFATLRDALAVAGERGTLATRLRGTALAGTLHAKTGSLDGVTGLAGFVDVKRPLRFALLVNGAFGESTGVSIREQMAQVIAGYPDAPPPEVLVPAPAQPVTSSREACPSSATAC